MIEENLLKVCFQNFLSVENYAKVLLKLFSGV